MAKGLGGGFPIGAIWVVEKHSNLFTPGSHGTTYGGSPLACSAAHAVLDIIDNENLILRAQTMGNLLIDGLKELVVRFPDQILEIRGRGLMLGLQLADDPSELISILRENGMLTVGAAGNTLRLLPPLTIKEDEIRRGLEILNSSLTQLKTE